MDKKALLKRPSPSRAVLAMAVCAVAACGRGAATHGTTAIRLVEKFDPSRVEGSPAEVAAAPPLAQWRFDTSPPQRPASGVGGPAAIAPQFAATRGFEAGPGVANLAVREGLLVGRTTTDFPIIRVERTKGLDDADQLEAVEIRMRVSGGANVSAVTRPSPSVDVKLEPSIGQRVPWPITTPIVAGGEMKTYMITAQAPVSSPRIRYVLVRPSDAAGAEFAIESLRLVFQRERLAGIRSGVRWQGLRDVFRETIVSRSPETLRFQVTPPARAVLDLAVGTPQDDPVTFHVAVGRGERVTPVMADTVTTPQRWERRQVDLAPFAGKSVTLTLQASADKPGTLAFWGAPTIRQRVDQGSSRARTPQGVILVQLDTLRKDHLDVYGYERQTAPVLRGLAGEGALFQNAITQTSWTKAATPSVMTSLYPTSHGVHQIADRLPASATTIAEAYRQAGYATLSYSSVVFTGQFTNLHQGFEELHEGESTAGRAGPRGAKTAREYVDRLVDWLGDHRDVPFFVYLHVFDPHAPYEPNHPFDTLWADPKGREEYQRQQDVLKKTITDAFMAQRGMATRYQLVQAGLDPESYIRYSKDWYDGAIRGMDTEIGRLVERLRDLGLGERTLIALYADHGEEFHDHGRMWHGQSVYGEMIRVPLILWGPGCVARGVSITEPVELIDVMPTLLDLSGIPLPPGIQGQSMRPLLGKETASQWKRRPPIAEKQPMDGTDFPESATSYAIMDGDWKLIHNVVRPPEVPEFELFDFYKDPLDQKNLAAAHPEVVERLGKALDAWQATAASAKLKPDAELSSGMSREQLEQLRSLGYVK